VHYDSTPDKSGGPLVNQGTDRVIEIWNLVFIQFNRNKDGSLVPLPARHVDTGMGFERITKVLQGKESNYDTDVFQPIFESIRRVTVADPYTGKLDDLKDTAYRVIADHVRTLTFALTDGATIGNVGRDYVLRRILRRAERYGVQVLGTGEPFLHKLVPTVVGLMGDVFPELKANPEKVREQIYAEEEGFLRTLNRGIKLFTSLVAQMRKDGRTQITGAEAFKLHDTYGVLIDITLQMAQEQEPPLTVDVAGFEQAMEDAKNKAREGGKKIDVAAVKGELPPTDDSPKYGTAQVEATVLGWVKDNAVIRSGKLTAGDSAALLLDRTGFYGEQGGQVGDQGTIHGPNGASFEVEDTQRLGETILHLGTLDAGELKPGDRVLLNQSIRRRVDVMRNHTATHLLNLALKQVLGGDVDQKGSLVDDEKTRFDFSHDKPLTAEQVRAIEDRVNRQIIRDQPVTPVVMPLAEAKKLPGVRAVFGEKYPDPVRVVMIGAEKPEQVTLDNSVEFCGGTHVPRTGLIGFFRVTAQEGVAKGVRRITAVTGRKAYEEVQGQGAVIEALTGRFQCRPE
jgi:alanyl-tRNA synthetase